MKENFLFVCYRDWAKSTHQNLKMEIPMALTLEELEAHIHNCKDLKYIFFVGWSEIVPQDIIDRFECFCLHPSDLPKYRGGSPIQHQVIDGVLDSAVTMFKMTSTLDAGPIYKKHYLSLDSKLDLIFMKVKIISSVLVNTFISDIESNSEIQLHPQSNEVATFRKRRKPEDSEITLEELTRLTAAELNRKIICLADPYPNAYLVCADGKKLFIKDSSL